MRPPVLYGGAPGGIMEVIKHQQKSLGELLLHASMITKDQLEEALAEQKNVSEPLGKILVRKGYVKEEDIINILKGTLVIVFELSSEMFGVEVVFTREILNFRKITPLPTMPPYMKGMASIRDHVIPVLSLNEIIFGRKDGITSESKIIVIVSKEAPLGILVDRVIAVRNYMPESFEDMSHSLITEEKKYISGIIKDRGELITLIKTEFFFTGSIHAGKK
jgi:purine-binding chemotaxis protein CheW